MSTTCKIHSDDNIAWIQQCFKDSEICVCARMWLDVCKITTKQLSSILNRKCFNFINVLTAVIVPLTWQTFCILVCKYTSSELHHCLTSKILRSNELDRSVLSSLLSVKNFFNG